MTELTIGNSVKNIGKEAFYNCGLSRITVYCNIPPVCGTLAFGGYSDSSYSASLMVPEGTLNDYAIANEWTKFNSIQEIAGVENVEIDDNGIEVSRYDIHGRLLLEPTKGINIVKYSNGVTRKEIVK